MLIPLKHDNLEARRWPVITIALIVLTVLISLATQGVMDQDSPELVQLKTRILLLATQHPELKLSSAEQKLVGNLRKQNDNALPQIPGLSVPAVGSTDAASPATDDSQNAQADMDSLARRYSQLSNASFAQRYAFVPAHPALISYLTAPFLDSSWLDLFSNMWFLWLAGFVLEDAWGRPLYAVFYLVAGAVALQMHAWMNAGSTIPALGASGAVAALMGAFLVRFPKMKIDMAWIFGFKLRRFKAEAFWLLGLWLLMEVAYGVFFGNGSGISHWAHIGAFAFGAVAAVALKYSGLEKKMSDGVDVKLNPDGALEIDEATGHLQRGNLDVAHTLVQGVLAAKPDSIDALNVLREVYWRRSQTAEYHEASAKLCAIYVKRQAVEPALQVYDEIISTGGDKLPVTTWLSLSRALEDAQMFDRALLEYEKVADAYPEAAQSIMAQLGAARICLKKLGRPQDALKFLRAADSSPVPHLDMEHSIQIATKEATAALATVPQPQMVKSLA